jgi:hypothetical protein
LKTFRKNSLSFFADGFLQKQKEPIKKKPEKMKNEKEKNANNSEKETKSAKDFF